MVSVYHDETIAAVFGAIWRYCQMEDGVCRASLDTIGGAIGVDKATVMRHAKTLCDDGYLKDLTPDLRNRPHIYAETGKIVMTSRIDGIAQRNAGIAQSNSRVAQRNASVAESKLNKDFKKDSIKQVSTTGAGTQNVFRLYESNIGPLTPMISEALGDHEKTYGPVWVCRAIEEAAKMNVRNLKYVEGVLKGYAQRGSPEIGRTTVKETRPARSRTPAETNDDIVRRMAQDAANNR
jgi:DnaD/phage-associated family protein